MADEQRNYWCLCDDNCRFPTMTSEQIIEAIAEATGETPVHIDDAFITKIKEQNAQGALRFWIGTRAEYNAIADKQDDVLYIVTGETELDVLRAEIAELKEQLPFIVTCTLDSHNYETPTIIDPSATYDEIIAAAVAGRTVILRAHNDNDNYTFFDYRLMRYPTAFVSAENSRICFVTEVMDGWVSIAGHAVIWVNTNNGWDYQLFE